MMRSIGKFLSAGLLLTMAFACNDSDEGRIIVRLTDSPGDYEEVNIDLQDVQIHRQAGDQESGWESLSANSGMYNLLDLTDGAEAVIADKTIPAGEVTQIRFVLGDGSNVVIDGQSSPLTTPSAYTSGLKVNVNATLLDGITYSLLLDFDAAKSVVKTGSGKFILKPVIRAVTEARDGAISGTVVPEAENVAVYAMVGEDTMATSYAIENSKAWFLGGLESGTYDVVFDPGELSTYAPATINGVSVTLGEINDVGETVLELK